MGASSPPPPPPPPPPRPAAKGAPSSPRRTVSVPRSTPPPRPAPVTSSAGPSAKGPPSPASRGGGSGSAGRGHPGVVIPSRRPKVAKQPKRGRRVAPTQPSRFGRAPVRTRVGAIGGASSGAVGMTPAHVRELGNLLSRSMGQLDDAVGVARQAERSLSNAWVRATGS